MKLLLSSLIASLMVTCTLAFAPSPQPQSKILQPNAQADDEMCEKECHRRVLLKTGSLVVASIFGFEGVVKPAEAIPEQKVYSSNARNFMRLGEGDSSGGSVYDNNPTSPKARMTKSQ